MPVSKPFLSIRSSAFVALVFVFSPMLMAADNASWSLGAQEFVIVKTGSSPPAMMVQLYGPSGELLRRYNVAAGSEGDFPFVTGSAGRYRLQAQALTPAAASTLQQLEWQIQRPATKPPRTSAGNTTVKDSVLSPRLQRLRAEQAQAGNARSVISQAFWQEVRAQGSPLVETLPDRPEHRLVTFLWQGRPGNRSVQLSWAMRAERSPSFERLGGSNVWFLSMVLPKAMRASYQLVVDPPALPAGLSADRVQRHLANSAVAQADPLNPLRWPQWPAGGTTDSDRFGQQSVLQLPDAPAEPWLDAPLRPEQRGTLEHLQLRSEQLNNERSITLYTPISSLPRPEKGWPVLFLFDREAYLERSNVSAVLDGLIAQGRIPPLVAVLVSNPTRASRGSELPANPAFADFMAQELLPWVRQRRAISHDPAQVVVAGSSYGGLAAAWIGYRHPQQFGNVLAMSGSFWWGPRNVPRTPGFDPQGEGEWLTRQFVGSPALPLRFYVSAGTFEITLTGDGGGILDSSRHFRNVLQAKGYPVDYREFAGGHDYLVWRSELAQGLMSLLGPKPVP